MTQVQQISSVRQKFGYFGMMAAILIVTAALCWGLAHISDNSACERLVRAARNRTTTGKGPATCSTRGSPREPSSVLRLADYVKVKGASLKNGLLHVDLVREIPEAMKPRAIPITSSSKLLEVKPTKVAA